MSKSKKQTSLISDKAVKQLVMFYCYFYLIVAIMTAIAILFRLFNSSFPFIYIVACIVAAVISIGIYYKKAWIPLTVLVIALIGIVSNLFSPVHNIFWILSLIFLAFEAVFFTSNDVRRYFTR